MRRILVVMIFGIAIACFIQTAALIGYTTVRKGCRFIRSRPAVRNAVRPVRADKIWLAELLFNGVGGADYPTSADELVPARPVSYFFAPSQRGLWRVWCVLVDGTQVPAIRLIDQTAVLSGTRTA